MESAEPQPTSINTTTDTRSYLQKLHAGEQHWAWKFSFRVAICVLDVVGIGCAAWLVQVSTNNFNDFFYFEFWTLPGSLTALTVSFIFCLVVVLIYFLRRPPSPIHPGICVGIDLILWLGLIVTGLFSIATVFGIIGFGLDSNSLGDPSYMYQSAYDGHYVLEPNNTWVYKITSINDPCDYNYNAKGCHYNYTTGTYTTNRTRTVHRTCTPLFSTCAQQDAYVNHLWHQKPLLEGTAITVAAAQWLGVIFHFILFVWACVDTHRYNSRNKRRYTQVDAQEIAQNVIRDMEARGLITVHSPGAARTEGMEMAQMSRPGAGPSREMERPVVAGPSREMPVVAGPSTGRGDDMEIGQAR